MSLETLPLSVVSEIVSCFAPNLGGIRCLLHINRSWRSLFGRAVQHFETETFAITNDARLAAILPLFPNLRSLVINGRSAPHAVIGPQSWSAIAKLSSLRTLVAPLYVDLRPSVEIATYVGNALATLVHLQSLELFFATTDTSRTRCYSMPPIKFSSALPTSLRSLAITHRYMVEINDDTVNFTPFAEDLAKLGHTHRIESIELVGGAWESIEWLHGFASLQHATFAYQQEVPSLSFHRLPALRSLNVQCVPLEQLASLFRTTEWCSELETLCLKGEFSLRERKEDLIDMTSWAAAATRLSRLVFLDIPSFHFQSLPLISSLRSLTLPLASFELSLAFFRSPAVKFEVLPENISMLSTITHLRLLVPPGCSFDGDLSARIALAATNVTQLDLPDFDTDHRIVVNIQKPWVIARHSPEELAEALAPLSLMPRVETLSTNVPCLKALAHFVSVRRLRLDFGSVPYEEMSNMWEPLVPLCDAGKLEEIIQSLPVGPHSPPLAPSKRRNIKTVLRLATPPGGVVSMTFKDLDAYNDWISKPSWD